MTSARVVSLLVPATVLSGWLAGAALDRAAVATPVWQMFGPEEWAAFSNRAAFGAGLTMDSVVAVIAIALMIVAAGSFFNRRRDMPFALIIAIVFSLIGLLLAAKAAYLVQLLAAAQPAADLQPIFDEYLIWGVDFRAAADAVAFVAVVWALSGLSLFAASGSSGAAEVGAADNRLADSLTN